MAGRPRRSRALLAVVFFLLVAIIYYNRTPKDSFDGYDVDSIGGGSVLRPGKAAGESNKDGAVGGEAYGQSSSSASSRHAAVTGSSSTSHSYSVSSAVAPVTQSISSALSVTTTAADVHNPQFHSGQEAELPDHPDEDNLEPAAPTPTKDRGNHWHKQDEKFPVSSTIQLPTLAPKKLPRIQYTGEGHVAEKQRAAVLDAMKHSWKGYKDNAWGSDEVMPVSGFKKNPFNGWGATLVDSLDTLWIMGMKEDFEEAVKAVAQIDFTTSSRSDIPLFEVTIRYLGGLLGAYDVSNGKYTVLLDKAVELAEVLLGAFDTPNRMPQTYYHWMPAFASQPHRASTRVVMAELGSLSVEFTRLAQITKEHKFYDAIARITDGLEELQNKTLLPGMWPLAIDASGCNKQVPNYANTPVTGKGSTSQAGILGPPMAHIPSPSNTQAQTNPLGSSKEAGIGKIAGFGDPFKEGSLDSKEAKDHVLQEINSHNLKRGIRSDANIDDGCHWQGLKSSNENGPDTFTLGGQSDSTYEYLPKQYILLGGNVDQYRKMYIAHAETARKELFFRPMTQDDRDVLISGQVSVRRNPSDGKLTKSYQAHGEHLTCFVGGMFAMAGKIFDRPGDVELGAKLTDGCVWTYNITTSGIMPEGFTALACENAAHCPWNQTEYWRHLDPLAATRPKKKKMPAGVADLPHSEPGSKSSDSQNSGDLLKRQLGEAAFADPKVPILNTSGSSENDGLVLDEPYVPTPVSPTKSEYTPPPPQTHEEYVLSRIEREKIPPGIITVSSSNYILRPEAIESVVYMYRITGKQYWRDVGWKMFQAIDKMTRTEYGFSAINDVTAEKPLHLDSMESFWTAETLKYFYLLFDDKDTWSLDDWVLNTEAHFFRRPK